MPGGRRDTNLNVENSLHWSVYPWRSGYQIAQGHSRCGRAMWFFGPALAFFLLLVGPDSRRQARTEVMVGIWSEQRSSQQVQKNDPPRPA